MTDADFQLRFEDYMNDYDILVTQGLPTIKLERKMYKLLGEHIEAHEKELYRTKNLQNGAD